MGETEEKQQLQQPVPKSSLEAGSHKSTQGP